MQPEPQNPESDTENGTAENGDAISDDELSAPPSPEGDDSVLTLFGRLRSGAVRGGDTSGLRDHLVMTHTSLVEHCARNFSLTGEPVEDLVQEGYVGLIKAVDRFDPAKGVRFSTYACHLINGEIRHYLRDLGKLIHEPGWHSELRSRITRAGEQISQKLGRPALPEEIAAQLNIAPETVREVQGRAQNLSVESLDLEGDNEDDSGPRFERNEEFSMPSGPVEARVDDQLLLRAALPQLLDLEKQVVQLFFFEEQSKTEVAKKLGISVNYAAYLLKKSIEHLRQIIDSGEVSITLTPAQQEARAVQLLALAGGTPVLDAAQAAAQERRASDRRANDRRNAGRDASDRRDADRRNRERRASELRANVGSFSEFAGWLDEEIERAARYNQELAMLWLRVENWNDVVAHLNAADVRRALKSLQLETRRCCRGVDKVALLTDAGALTDAPDALPGLHLFVLMPHTGEGGEQVGRRWIETTQSPSLQPKIPGALQAAFAFATFPRDGKTSDALFKVLGKGFGRL